MKQKVIDAVSGNKGVPPTVKVEENDDANDREIKNEKDKKVLLTNHLAVTKVLMIIAIVLMTLQIIFAAFCLFWFNKNGTNQ
jgi:lactate dehydrogenase-like 2-hydroxyacid dehydrogenase